MTEVLKIITDKPAWQGKLNDVTITNKWREELNAQGIPNPVVDKIFQLLQKSLNKTEYEQEDSYEWHLEVGADPGTLWPTSCDCKCQICEGEEHLEQWLEDYEEGDEDYRDIMNKMKKYKKIKCKCADYNTKHSLEFLRSNIHHQMGLVNKDLKERFIAHAKDFQSRKGFVDYHPGSNNQMLDIIHPSLYCYVKDVSEVHGPDAAQLIEKSDLFQWLPAEFSVKRDEAGNPVRTEINSYINNLDRNDPANAGLYEDIGEIFTKVVPGFEKIVNNLQNENKIKAIKDQEQTIPPCKLNDCQVIVKIANAEVNSDKPIFDEGSWHLEGIDAEKIIGTCVYYYEMKNIQKTYLRFRTTVEGDVYGLNYPQNCHQYVEYHYGLKLCDLDGMDGCRLDVKLGRIPTKENLCLFFPNFMQHRVSKIQLKEGCTEGNRGILVFFLINPYEKVVSTANVPPQHGKMSLEDAKLYRELLMFERKFEYSEQNAFHQRGLSLCEH